jgi:IS1 family transposase
MRHYPRLKNKLWIWKAYCRDTGQLIDRECGDRGQGTLAGLISRLGKWKIWYYFTDDWNVYPTEIPEDQLS